MPGRKKKAAKGKARSAGKPSRKPRKKPARKVASKSTKKGAKSKRRTSRPRSASGTSSRKSAGKKVGASPSKGTKPHIRYSKSRFMELRAMLETKRAEVLGEIRKAREDSMKNDHTSFPEVGDLVSASVEKEKAFEHGEAGVNALREINAALEKLKAGTYGICEICGKGIGVKRLQVMPSARLCIKCKSREEASAGVSPGRSGKYGD